jgi:DNA-binding SARP family transcriptional activator
MVATIPPVEADRIEVRLLDAFEVELDGVPVELPLASQRLVAFLALNNRPVLRSHVAGCLWGDRPDERAGACLRSALWRANRACPLVISGRTHVRLDRGVAVDATETAVLARQLLSGEDAPGIDIRRLRSELLPDWYEDWVLLERERLRQLCLNALEQLSTSLLSAGHTALAIDAALAVVLSEPLRETGHRALIKAHIVSGNRSEALNDFHRYERSLATELGLQPSPDLIAVMRESGLLMPTV